MRTKVSIIMNSSFYGIWRSILQFLFFTFSFVNLNSILSANHFIALLQIANPVTLTSFSNPVATMRVLRLNIKMAMSKLTMAEISMTKVRTRRQSNRWERVQSVLTLQLSCTWVHWILTLYIFVFLTFAPQPYFLCCFYAHLYRCP
jgi:hypothetical protein